MSETEQRGNAWKFRPRPPLNGKAKLAVLLSARLSTSTRRQSANTARLMNWRINYIYSTGNQMGWMM